MKLYTEEQVRKAIELARLIQEKGSVEDSFDVESISGLTEICTYGWSERYSTDEISEQLIPIELPSDEEIEIEAEKIFAYKGTIMGFEVGAKWLKEQILKQNNMYSPGDIVGYTPKINNMAQQTAVNWLIEQLEVFVTLDEELTWDKLFDKAKQIEKEQIINAHINSSANSSIVEAEYLAEQYYNETYKKQ